MKEERLSLLTLNGRCRSVKKKIQLYNISDSDLISKYGVKTVRNFLTFKIGKLGIHTFIYSRGGFKITLSANRYCQKIIQNIDFVISSIVKILEVFYHTHIDKVSVKVTQIAILIRSGIIPQTKLTYNRLSDLFPIERNCITVILDNFKLVHEINHMCLEEGTSSYYFTITEKNKKKGGLKIYNNLKCVLYSFRIRYVEILSETVHRFVEIISN